MYDCGFSCILGDEMGVGKTLQTICFLFRLRERGVKGPFLIATPFAAMSVWRDELKKWSQCFKLPEFQVFTFHGKNRTPPPNDSQIVLTVHQTFAAQYDILSSYIKKWEVVIVDEAHKAKDQKNALSKCLPALEAEMYLLITGTLVNNNVDRELARLLELVLPSAMTEQVDLQQLMKNVIAKEKGGKGNKKKEEEDEDEEEEEGLDQHQLEVNEADLKGLKDILECCRLRRLLPPDLLPGKKTCTVMIEQSDVQLQIYQKLNDVQQTHAVKRLQKICDLHPLLFHGNKAWKWGKNPKWLSQLETERDVIKAFVEQSHKVKFILKSLQVLKARSTPDAYHRTIIFSNSVVILYLLGLTLKAKDFSVDIITGMEQSSQTRYYQQERFNQKPEFMALLLCTKAMSESVQLQGADTVIFFDQSYNPQTDRQAEGRAYRRGQTKPVLVLKLVTTGKGPETTTAEEDQVKSIMDWKRAVINNLEYEEEDIAKSKALHERAYSGGGQTKKRILKLEQDSALEKLLLDRQSYRDLPPIKLWDDEVYKCKNSLFET